MYKCFWSATHVLVNCKRAHELQMKPWITLSIPLLLAFIWFWVIRRPHISLGVALPILDEMAFLASCSACASETGLLGLSRGPTYIAQIVRPSDWCPYSCWWHPHFQSFLLMIDVLPFFQEHPGCHVGKRGWKTDFAPGPLLPWLACPFQTRTQQRQGLKGNVHRKMMGAVCPFKVFHLSHWALPALSIRGTVEPAAVAKGQSTLSVALLCFLCSVYVMPALFPKQISNFQQLPATSSNPPGPPTAFFRQLSCRSWSAPASGLTKGAQGIQSLHHQSFEPV